MMSLDIWQKKIQEKRKQTPFRDFLLEVASWWSINLYRNDKNISVFPPTERSGAVVGLQEYYKQYDSLLDGSNSTGDFFNDFSDLFINHAKPAIFHVGSNENADYCNTCFGAKNAYLSFVSGFNTENIFYSTQTWENTSNVFNSSLVTNGSNNIYSSRVVQNSFNIFYSQYIYNSSDMRFCSSCIGCHYCIDCDGLENMSYCITNIQYSKEEFENMQSTYTSDKFMDLYAATFAKKGKNFSSINVVGTGLYKCHNSTHIYNSMNYSESRNIVFSDGLTGVKNYYDCIDTGTNSNDFYAICQGGEDSNHCYMCNFVSMGCFNIFYSIHMESCSFCFGCIGLKNKSYCIINKQYTKEERHQKVDEIFSQMEKEGTLGSFFPGSMNPFYFNDTAAYLIDPSFTKEEVTAKGYLRRDEPVKVDIPDGAQVVKVSELGEYEGFNGEGKRMIDPAILNKIIVDEQGNYYRIVKMEYDFLVKHGLPLPRKHWLDRMKENFKISFS